METQSKIFKNYKTDFTNSRSIFYRKKWDLHLTAKYTYILQIRTSVGKFKLLILLGTIHIRKYTAVYSAKLILFFYSSCISIMFHLCHFTVKVGDSTKVLLSLYGELYLSSFWECSAFCSCTYCLFKNSIQLYWGIIDKIVRCSICTLQWFDIYCERIPSI